MTADAFTAACDQLSQTVDAVQFERLRWARDEGPMVARLVALTQAAFAERSDFDLSEEGSSAEIKRYVVKVHGMRVIAVAIGLVGRRVVMAAEAIDRSRFKLMPGEPISAEFAEVDEAWIAAGLQELFGRVRN